MKITTVNVNGVRAAFRKGFGDWLANDDSELYCLQEVRATVEDTVTLFGSAFDVRVWPCRIKGRAGVALVARRDSAFSLGDTREGLPAALYDESGEPDVDSGRWLEAEVSLPGGGSLTLVSAYLHSGELESEKQEQKLAYLERATKRLSELAATARAAGAGAAQALVCGDFNIVRTERDIKNWKPNHNKVSGVMDEEIAILDAWMSDSLEGTAKHPAVDVTRALLGEVQGPYTWWSQRGKAFDNDAGWRIDYQMATPGLATHAAEVSVWRAPSYAERWSDHAPLSITYQI
ncbi:putative exodeoxyribonuclease III [Mobiluncus mulieris FB024-16]|uniref:exodeoxyribonuclease III n=1 Tax=Mobiluncus mulieris TaxID=2052 RepID=UPI0001E5181E|nr:exodeoxyribonuclease III [Mobiluncus mulieris]EFN93999.1 putative exodeoxyribonuclease III [Mobiluncus mulieris FB024-16]